MKVLFITDPGIVGGATKSLVELVGTLKKYGVEITVVTSEYNQLNIDLEALGFFTIACNHLAAMEPKPLGLSIFQEKRWFLKRKLKYIYARKNAIKKINNSLDISQFDIIHTNSARNDLGCYLSSKYRIPHIMHIREFGTLDFNCSFLHSHYYSFINNSVDVFIAISEAVKDYWCKCGISKNKVTVIYNGIDYQRILPKDSNEFVSSNLLKLVACGGIYPSKGQYRIIEAMGKLPESIREKVTLDLYGWSDEWYIKSLEDKARIYGVEKQIKWHGPVNDVYEYLCKYDVGITCSNAEGFGRTTAEYMHAGLGVIVSNSGANEELITDREEGLVFELKDIENLAKKIEEFYYDRDFLASCAKSAKQKALSLYTKERNASEVYKVYSEIIRQVNE